MTQANSLAAASRGFAAATTADIRAIPNAPASITSLAFPAPTPPRAKRGRVVSRHACARAAIPTGGPYAAFDGVG